MQALLELWANRGHKEYLGSLAPKERLGLWV